MITVANKKTLLRLMETDVNLFAKECSRYGTIIEDKESFTKIGLKRELKYSIHGVIASVVMMSGEIWGVGVTNKREA